MCLNVSPRTTRLRGSFLACHPEVLRTAIELFFFPRKRVKSVVVVVLDSVDAAAKPPGVQSPLEYARMRPVLYSNLGHGWWEQVNRIRRSRKVRLWTTNGESISL
jgi:hypothetical protein